MLALLLEVMQVADKLQLLVDLAQELQKVQAQGVMVVEAVVSQEARAQILVVQRAKNQVKVEPEAKLEASELVAQQE
jgi:hypothetical protein